MGQKEKKQMTREEIEEARGKVRSLSFLTFEYLRTKTDDKDFSEIEFESLSEENIRRQNDEESTKLASCKERLRGKYQSVSKALIEIFSNIWH